MLAKNHDVSQMLLSYCKNVSYDSCMNSLLDGSKNSTVNAIKRCLCKTLSNEDNFKENSRKLYDMCSESTDDLSRIPNISSRQSHSSNIDSDSKNLTRCVSTLLRRFTAVIYRHLTSLKRAIRQYIFIDRRYKLVRWNPTHNAAQGLRSRRASSLSKSKTLDSN